MKMFIDIIRTKALSRFSSTVGVLGPACSNTVEAIAGVSKHYRYPNIYIFLESISLYLSMWILGPLLWHTALRDPQPVERKNILISLELLLQTDKTSKTKFLLKKTRFLGLICSKFVLDLPWRVLSTSWAGALLPPSPQTERGTQTTCPAFRTSSTTTRLLSR